MFIYVFDGSLEGLLSAVFEWFERKPGPVQLKLDKHYQPDAFSDTLEIVSDHQKAARVWKGLQKKIDREGLRRIYCAFLSELPEVYDSIFRFVIYVFQHPAGAEKNYGNQEVLHIAQTAKKVSREKHRMEAFVRFKLTSDGIFYCGIDPDFNVLPLIMQHFKKRYADQKWIIYDVKRHYGLFYDLQKLQEIKVTLEEEKNFLKSKNQQQLNENEEWYASLWKDYFKSTNILSRKNTKLHVQSVPKRYWKYLTEKEID